MTKTDITTIDTAREWIERSDSVLFSAGAGLTAAAGINYGDTELFAREFPAMLQYGFTAQYQLIGFSDWDPELQWGYWAAHVDLVRHRWPRTAPYQALKRIADNFDPAQSYVFTSNVDAMFERNGFDTKRIHTPQGDYALLQCTTPCTNEVWEWKDQLDAIRSATDPETQRTTSELVPSCPNCGESVFPNVRADRTFVDEHFGPTSERLGQWISEHREAAGVVIEVGAGFNTPSVIRWPSEHIVEAFPEWRLIRINLDRPEVPAELGARAVGLGGDAAQIIAELVS